VKYKTYSLDDVNAFMDGYCQSNASWVAHDYGKPGLPAGLQSKVWTPTMDKAFVKKKTGKNKNQCTIVSHASFDAEALEEYGAVSDVWIQYEVSESSVGITIGLFNKTTTRLPESMFVQWHPFVAGEQATAATTEGVSWAAKSLGAWVDSADIVDGGSKRLFGANALRAGSKNGPSAFEVASTDALVASFGELNAYPTPTNMSAKTDEYGASHVLWDNLWGTNYIMWWPFVVPPPEPFAGSAEYFPVDGNADFAARFTITLSP